MPASTPPDGHGDQATLSYDCPRNLHFGGTAIWLQKSFPAPNLPIPNKTAGWALGDPTVDLQERVQVERAW